ncbi:hypothetical protein CK203_013080 [Vitis vinifera]|uniref:Uncharacterized protein n=1 Tax=Vitis vinifera TaxID=29760 RepID=A0A438JLZ4_VITVI|nr:hypothetical protein CK203_013080 [Vitis vinifera]
MGKSKHSNKESTEVRTGHTLASIDQCAIKKEDYATSRTTNGSHARAAGQLARRRQPPAAPPARAAPVGQHAASQHAAGQRAAGQHAASAQPASTQPASAQPASTQPASAQPASTQPASAQPARASPRSAPPPSVSPRRQLASPTPPASRLHRQAVDSKGKTK